MRDIQIFLDLLLSVVEKLILCADCSVLLEIVFGINMSELVVLKLERELLVLMWF